MTSKRAAAKFIRAALRAGWSREIDISRRMSSDPQSSPWLIMVTLRRQTRWDWSQIIVNFRRGRRGVWIVSFSGVSNASKSTRGRTLTTHGIWTARREFERMAYAAECDARLAKKGEIEFDI